MAAVQFISYTNLVMNTRALSAGLIPHSIVTDVTASAISFFIIRKIAKEESWIACLGMMVGGGAAAAFGIWITRHWQ